MTNNVEAAPPPSSSKSIPSTYTPSLGKSTNIARTKARRTTVNTDSFTSKPITKSVHKYDESKDIMDTMIDDVLSAIFTTESVQQQQPDIHREKERRHSSERLEQERLASKRQQAENLQFTMQNNAAIPIAKSATKGEQELVTSSMMSAHKHIHGKKRHPKFKMKGKDCRNKSTKPLKDWMTNLDLKIDPIPKPSRKRLRKKKKVLKSAIEKKGKVVEDGTASAEIEDKITKLKAQIVEIKAAAEIAFENEDDYEEERLSVEARLLQKELNALDGSKRANIEQARKIDAPIPKQPQQPRTLNQLQQLQQSPVLSTGTLSQLSQIAKCLETKNYTKSISSSTITTMFSNNTTTISPNKILQASQGVGNLISRAPARSSTAKNVFLPQLPIFARCDITKMNKLVSSSQKIIQPILDGAEFNVSKSTCVFSISSDLQHLEWTSFEKSSMSKGHGSIKRTDIRNVECMESGLKLNIQTEQMEGKIISITLATKD